jgi:hypothetical protein
MDVEEAGFHNDCLFCLYTGGMSPAWRRPVQVPTHEIFASPFHIVFSASILSRSCLERKPKKKEGGHVPSAGAGKISSSMLRVFLDCETVSEVVDDGFCRKPRERREERRGAHLRSYLGLVVTKRIQVWGWYRE